MVIKTVLFIGEECSKDKLNKECIAVAIGSKISGTDRLKPIVIGKMQNPHCFKNARNLPCDYESEVKESMSSDLIKFISKFDKRMKQKSRRLLCLVDKSLAQLKNLQIL